MRILLLYPEFPDTFWSFKHALRFVLKRASFPPLGLLTVAAMLPPEWELKLVDMNIVKLEQRDIEWADYVFVSAMVAQRDSTIEVLNRCREHGSKIVAGGPLFLGEHEHYPQVDHFVLGEGELAVPLLVADLQRGEAKRIYQVEGYPDITLSPAPLWHLADLDKYSSMCVQFSRGCPFNCEFCNITAMLGHRPRTKSADQIISELEGLYQLGWRGGVFFVDDNFIGNKRVLKEDVLPALTAWRAGKRGFGFHTEASINLADDAELMQMMTAAGFEKVFVGIETPDEDGLAECHKVQNEGRDLVSAVKTLQRNGLEVQGGFIVGFDSDKPSIFQRQIEFIQSSGIVTAMVGLLQAPYGTKLYSRMEKEGRLTGDFSGNNSDNTMNFVPKMDTEMLHAGYREIVRTIYSPKEYYGRVRTFLAEYGKSSAVRPALGLNYAWAFVRSVVQQGLVGKGRREYWKLFFWTLFRRPHLFADAITFAVYGFHFQRICDLYVGALGD
jgi:radical SAM superfamily enzyme YgiQ (UPF0313 family)